MCVNHGSYPISMENKCKMAIKNLVLNMNVPRLYSEKSSNDSNIEIVASYFIFFI
jgi:hypothetical protein